MMRLLGPVGGGAVPIIAENVRDKSAQLPPAVAFLMLAGFLAALVILYRYWRGWLANL